MIVAARAEKCGWLWSRSSKSMTPRASCHGLGLARPRGLRPDRSARRQRRRHLRTALSRSRLKPRCRSETLPRDRGRTGWHLAAKAAGFAVVTTRSAFCRESPAFGGDTVVVEDLPSLIPGRDRHRHDHLSSEDRADLLSALQRLHAGNCESLADLHWSDQMRVSDILKTKGSAVKTSRVERNHAGACP